MTTTTIDPPPIKPPETPATKPVAREFVDALDMARKNALHLANMHRKNNALFPNKPEW